MPPIFRFINAGDGGHNILPDPHRSAYHPSHEGFVLNGGLCGDLKRRTVHHYETLTMYSGVRFMLISPEELVIPDYIRKEVLDKNNIEYKELRRLEEAIGKLDILYMTRVQKERFFNEEDYVRLKDSYILDQEKMSMARDDMIVLHPLPRVNEIAPEVDRDPRAVYFKQARYGMYVRMALIMKLLGVDDVSGEGW